MREVLIINLGFLITNNEPLVVSLMTQYDKVN